jgi:DNA-binding transcriptional regulator YiaG
MNRKSKRKRRRGWHTSFQSKFSHAVNLKINGDFLVDEVGYTVADVRAYLESLFVTGMSWSNYAGNIPNASVRCGWHIDHIIPKSAFGQDERRKAYALDNIRPLWAIDNLKKGARTEVITDGVVSLVTPPQKTMEVHVHVEDTSKSFFPEHSNRMTPQTLEAIMDELELTGIVLAERLDVDRKTVSRWLNGVAPIPGSVALLLSVAHTALQFSHRWSGHGLAAQDMPSKRAPTSVHRVRAALEQE